MPTVEGLQFAYTLYPLPPGRLPFQRWRWELWHGSNLVAAGWRLARPDAGRALRVHAAEFGHRLFGLPAPARDPRVAVGDLRPGSAERVAIGSITCMLVPRALEAPEAIASQHRAIVDLRSDTVTRPTSAMRRAIADAPVGDDQYGEDPSVNVLQAQVAELLGKEAALFVPTGTMANQLPLKLYCRPGDDVIVGVESHAVWHETGAAAANAGVQFTEVGSGGRFSADEFLAARKPRGHLLYPPTTLVEVENTQNRKGGLVWDLAELERVGATAREHGVASYLDGARLLNAAVARGEEPAALAAPFDLVAIALSKGLGGPAGSVLAGTAPDIAALLRYRRMLGGAMRQAGVLAAAGSYALAHHVERLVDDHANARLIGVALHSCAGVAIDLDALETNIVVFHLREGAPDAAAIVARAGERDVKVMAFGPRTVRAVTHLDVSRADCERAAEVLSEAVT